MADFDPGIPQHASFNGFGPAPIPDPRDRDVDAYLESVIAGGPPVFAVASASASESGRRIVRTHAERLASRAVRDRDPALLVPAVVSAVLGGLDRNDQEAMMGMALIDDAGSRLGVDLPTLFEGVAKIVGHPGTVNLMVWLNRAPEDRTPEAMGFVAARDIGGFRYRWVS